MFFEREDSTLVNIYRCRGCSKLYHRQLGPTYVSCAVMHGAGSCCHYGELSITEQQVADIRAILKVVVPQHNADGSVTIEVTSDPNGNANITITNDVGATTCDPNFHTPGSDF